MGKTFNIVGDATFEAEDIDDAFMRLALHFASLASGVELEETIITGGQLLVEPAGRGTARFLLFAGDSANPSGGWDDFHDSFKTAKGAKAEASELTFNWVHIVDIVTQKVRWSGGRDGDGNISWRNL